MSVRGRNVPKDDLKNVLKELSDRQKDKVEARTFRRDLSVLQTKGVIRHDRPDKGSRWLILIDKTK